MDAAEEDATENRTVYEEVNVLGVGVECKLRQVTKAAWKGRIGECAAVSVEEMVRRTVGCSGTSSVMGGAGAVKGGKGDEEVYCNRKKRMARRIEFAPETRYEEKWLEGGRVAKGDKRARVTCWGNCDDVLEVSGASAR